jgi:biotin synthase
MCPEKVRLSIGTAGLLLLDKLSLKVKPTTAYLMTFTDEGCKGNCTFCPQARESHTDRSRLSRVLWPTYPTKEVLGAIGRMSAVNLKRICIQAVNYPHFFEDVLSLLKGINSVTNIPVSLDTCPLTREQIEKLNVEGLDRIGIPLDAATPMIFNKVKGSNVNGPYSWKDHIESLEYAVSIFGTGKVLSNLIIGIGETEEEAISLIQKLMDRGIQTSLFAFTPVPGTILQETPQPPLVSYRRIQVARHLITFRLSHYNDMNFNERGVLVDFGADTVDLIKVLENGEPFCTTGCPGCNRPFYNERATGPLFNYPRELTAEEAAMEVEKLVRCMNHGD